MLCESLKGRHLGKLVTEEVIEVRVVFVRVHSVFSYEHFMKLFLLWLPEKF